MIPGMIPDAPAPGGVVGEGEGAVDALRKLVLDDPAVHAKLGAFEIPDDYVAAVAALAVDHGVTVSAETIRDAIRPDPLGIERFMASPVTLDRWPASGWLPARSVPTESAPAFDWAWFGEAPLRAPFYEESVRRFAPRPFSQMFRTRTSMAALVAGAEAADGPEPSGFIHHMSRCGSTLVAQMLAADPSHVVLSEPDPLDAVVRWAMESGAPPDEQVAALRAIVAALGRDRSGGTRRIFFKLDSWHTFALPLFRAAFPRTPWVYLYRDPVEVMVSQMRERGIHTVPGLLPPAIIAVPDGESMTAERYTALAFARMIEAVIDHWSIGGGLLVDYAELPGAAIDRIAPHFGFTPDAEARAAMARVAMRSAKAPDEPFVPDSAEKRAAATPSIAAAAREVLDPLHARLRAMRA